MSDRSVIGLRQAVEFDDALGRNGCDKALVKWLSSGNVLSLIRQVYEGRAEIKPKAEMDIFVHEFLTSWYGTEDMLIANVRGMEIAPGSADFTSLAQLVDSTRFGEYTLNLEMKNFDFSTLRPEKIKILSLPEMGGRPLIDVLEDVATNCGRYILPGFEMQKWLTDPSAEKSEGVLEMLRDGNLYFFIGSLVRSSGGRAFVPGAHWGASEWGRGARWLGLDWRARCRVVLLET